jgi:hypothetical protein
MLHFLMYCFYEIFADLDGNERETKVLNLNWSEWDAHAEDQQVGVRDVIGLEGELFQGEQDSTWEFCNCAEETGRAGNKRAHATEVPAGMAAAQAVAALQIAEEAQAQAQAAQKAAEEAMNEALDHHDPCKRPEYLYEVHHEKHVLCGLTSSHS